jgi:hypothetical protein
MIFNKKISCNIISIYNFNNLKMIFRYLLYTIVFVAPFVIFHYSYYSYDLFNYCQNDCSKIDPEYNFNCTQKKEINDNAELPFMFPIYLAVTSILTLIIWFAMLIFSDIYYYIYYHNYLQTTENAENKENKENTIYKK